MTTTDGHGSLLEMLSHLKINNDTWDYWKNIINCFMLLPSLSSIIFQINVLQLVLHFCSRKVIIINIATGTSSFLNLWQQFNFLDYLWIDQMYASCWSVSCIIFNLTQIIYFHSSDIYHTSWSYHCLISHYSLGLLLHLRWDPYPQNEYFLLL